MHGWNDEIGDIRMKYTKLLEQSRPLPDAHSSISSWYVPLPVTYHRRAPVS
jgi:hypothetical protein